MKKETAKTIALLVLTIGLIIAFFWIRNLKQDQIFSDNLVKELKMASEQKVTIPETKILKDLSTSQTYAKTEIIPRILPQSSLPSPLVRYYEDTVKAAILKASNTKKDLEILEYTKLIGQLKGELSSKNSKISQTQDSVLDWRNKYIHIVSNFKNRTSTYEYEGDIDLVRTKEKGKEYLYATSKDSAFKFNKSYTYKKEIKPIKDLFKLAAVNQVNFPLTDSGGPFYAQTGLRLRFNPDGFLQPYLGGYYWLDMGTGKGNWVGGIGLDLKLLER